MKEWIEKEEMLDMLCWAEEQRFITHDAAQVLYENIQKLETIKTEE